jgi:zinc transporter, ZIP family
VGAYLVLTAVDGWLRGRRKETTGVDALEGGDDGRPLGEDGHGRPLGEDGPGRPLGEDAARSAWRAAFLVALGIGLHNLGEGLAIGSAYAVGSLALGAALVVGFALHNTTEGLAIVAPTARARLSLGRLALLGLLAGAPAVLGAWIGASAFHPSVAALLFGVGAGAIAQVIVQILPQVRERDGRLLSPLVSAGLLAGLLVMYATGLLVSV